jgi:predicted TIM-barrel fold metal-dependent hydrolase
MEQNPYRFRRSQDMHRGGVAASPLPCRIVSNEEFQPPRQTQRQALVERLIENRGRDLSRALGMNRRAFLKTSGGMALALLTMNSVFGKFFDVLDVEAADSSAFAERQGEPYFILDVQTHYVSAHYDPENKAPHSGRLPKGAFLNLRRKAKELGWNPELKNDKVTLQDLDWRNFIKEVYLDSETSVAVLSTPPGLFAEDAVVPPKEMAHIREEINRLTASRRMLTHGFTAPQLGQAAQDDIAMQVETLKIEALKLYTGFPAEGFGHGWWMDDEKIAYPILERARKLGLRRVCVHKGLPLGPDADYNHPRDMIKAAKDFPEILFLIYHAGLKDADTAEHEFKKSGQIPWTTEFCRMKQKEPGIKNIYMEIGNSFAQLVGTYPEICAHWLGQILQAFGDDHVVWGTDSIWYGSPQWQIEAFRRFQIPDQLIEKHRYPKLTRQVKEKIFGLTGAKVYGVDVNAKRHEFPKDYIGKIKMAYLDSGPEPSHRYYGWAIR